MLLKIKNKMLLNMDKTLSKAEQLKAVPDFIELDVEEAKRFLHEVKEVKPDDVRVVSHNSEPLHSLLMRLKEDEFLEYWMNDGCSFWYRGVLMKIVNKPKKPEGPPNETIKGFNWPWKK